MTKVIIVDDQALVRIGLKRILTHQDRVQVIAECEDGDEVEAAVSLHRPDAVLMDVRMKRMDGIEATRALAARAAAPPVMMLTTFDDEQILWAALDAGAAGFVLKDASADELIRATRVVAGGGAWIDPEVAGRLIAGQRRLMPGDPAEAKVIATLTEREREVLVLMAKGCLNGEIAALLGVGEATVKTHVSNLFGKLGARDRAAAIVFAYESGFVSTGLVGGAST